jgi:hypothetical protein
MKFKQTLSKTIYITETNSSDGGWFDPKTNTIYWNPNVGMLSNEGIVSSPTVQLNHEGDHTLQYNTNLEQINIDTATPDTDYVNKEERRVITGSEQETARKLGEIKGDEVTRRDHGGTLYPVEGPTPTTLVNAGVTVEAQAPKPKKKVE